MVAARNNQTSFNLSVSALFELLNMMDAASHNAVGNDRRKYVRHLHTSKDTYFKVVQPGGGTTERLVTVRDLAAGGVCILYPGYLHDGSAVQIELRKRLGGTELIVGRVTNCRHVNAAWHAIGIKFKDVIFPQLFLYQEARSNFVEADAVKVDPSRLKGSILLVDDQVIDRNLFVHLLRGSSLRVTQAATLEEAIALIVRSLPSSQRKGLQPTEAFDLVVCDLNLGDEKGETAIAQIREKGFRGPSLVMTAETSPERIAAALAAGGTGILQKPYSAEKLHAAIAGQLGDGCVAIDDPIYSPLCTDPQSRILVEKYVAHVRAMAAELRKFAVIENLAKIRLLCQTLKGTGAGYGFAALTDVAAATLVSLDASQSVAESINDLHRLDAICSRMTSSEPPAQGPAGPAKGG